LKKIQVISAILLLCVGLISFWLLTAGPVLVEWYYGINFGAICDPPFVILNPFRNKDAEFAADGFLNELKKGNTDVLNQTVSDIERREHFRLRESELSPISWFSGSRNQVESEADINYWIERRYDGGCHSLPANIGLMKIDGRWVVTRYSPIY
jgi:hypothetical protein